VRKGREGRPMTQGATEGAVDGEASTEAAPAGCGPPGWLRFVALASAAGVLSFGCVGLLLAINGWYRPPLAFGLGGVVWIGVLLLARPAFMFAPKAVSAKATRDAHVYAAVGVAAILCITAWNAAHASQHVMLNRDGGSYANTARWIARDGSLEVKPRVGPFANPEPGLRFDSNAVYAMPNGTLQFQFAHMLPVVLAEAYAIGGDAGLFHGPEVLGGIALLAFFVLAWRLFRRPLFALSAMLALAFAIPQVSFSRDSYSEIPSQILLFTALWLLVTPGMLPKWRLALTSGLFLGALETIRIDAIVFLIGVPVLLAVVWVRSAPGEARRSALLRIGAFVAGLVPGLVLGFVDLTRHSGHYYLDLLKNLRQLEQATVASLIVCALVAAVWPRLGRGLRRLPRPRVATTVAVVVGCAGFFAWLIRPRLQHLHSKAVGLIGGLQGLEHVAIDPTRNYWERSMVWMSWYLGPLTVAAAIIGAAFLTRELLLGRRLRAVGALVVLAPGSALYLYKASAVSDQVWVTRRFLVSAFPLLVLLALGLASACAGIRPGRKYARASTVGAVVFAVVAVAYPLYTVIGVRSMTEQRGFLTIVNEACKDLGSHAAVVVLQRDESDLFDDKIPQTLRGFCGADVGVIHGPARADTLHRLAREWNAEGRRLFVVAQREDIISKLFPAANVEVTRQAVNTHALQQTLTHRPHSYSREALSMAVAEVPTG
jgi:hypothetical protein